MGCGHLFSGSDSSRGPVVPAVHVVRAGDTLSEIADRYQIRVRDIVALNQLPNAHSLKVGQKLRLPKPVWRRSETQSSSRRKPYIRDGHRQRIRPPSATCSAHSPAPSDWAVSGAGFIWPVDGVVLTGFGHFEGRLHEGLAIGAPLRTPVWASQPGRVIIAEEQKGYGRLVALRHHDGRTTLYGSLNRICVQAEDLVRRGQLVGLVGISSGVASPRLYFELRGSDQTPVNPWRVLP